MLLLVLLRCAGEQCDDGVVAAAVTDQLPGRAPAEVLLLCGPLTHKVCTVCPPALVLG